MLATELRLIRLGIVVRLRRLGWWPWLVFVAWVLFARGQEPLLLRGFGIHLCWQGAWSGAIILLLALVGLGPPEEVRNVGLRSTVTRMVEVSGATLFVALAHAFLTGLVEAVLGGVVPLAQALTQAAGFTLVWLPAAIATTLVSSPRLPVAARIVVVVVPVGFSLAASTLWFSQSTTVVVVASLLATAGAGCLVATLLRMESNGATIRTP